MTADLAGAMAEPKVGVLGWRNWVNLVAYGINAVITFASVFGAFGPDNTELSAKYQLLITPAGFAFSIWGPIFIWEGCFAVAQMLPQYCSSKFVELAMPGWVLACLSQALWSIIFAQEWIALALVCMLGILLGLFIVAWRTDGHPLSWSEYFLLRGGFSLHMGWVTAASALNINVLADSLKAQPETMLGLAVASVGMICVVDTCLALATKSPDPVVCLVAAWAFNAIRVELGDPQLLNDPNRFNPHAWDTVTLGGLRVAAGYVTWLALLLAAVAGARVLLAEAANRSAGGKRASTDVLQELSKDVHGA